MSDLFVIWLAAFFCVVAGIERPDRWTFWHKAFWFCVVADVVHGLFLAGAAS